MKAVWRGHVLAESDDTTVVDGYTYFPKDAVRFALLQASDHRTTCYWKGQAAYFHATAGGESGRNVAWTYPEPSEAAVEAGVKDRIGFWKDVEIRA